MTEEWFYCGTCDVYIDNLKEAVESHRDWGHSVKRRSPLRKRLVYRLSGNRFNTLTVDNDEWTVALDLLLFRAEKPTEFSKGEKWKFIGTAVLDGTLKEVSEKLSHLYGFKYPISEKELQKLLETSIRKGVYEEVGEGQAKLYLCLDSDLRLESRTSKSKWTTTTRSKLVQLIKSPDVSLEKAYRQARTYRT